MKKKFRCVVAKNGKVRIDEWHPIFVGIGFWDIGASSLSPNYEFNDVFEAMAHLDEKYPSNKYSSTLSLIAKYKCKKK